MKSYITIDAAQAVLLRHPKGMTFREFAEKLFPALDEKIAKRRSWMLMQLLIEYGLAKKVPAERKKSLYFAVEERV